MKHKQSSRSATHSNSNTVAAATVAPAPVANKKGPLAWIKRNWWIIPIAVVSLSLLVAGGLVTKSKLSPQIVTCPKSTEDFKCWQKHFQQLIAAKSPEAAFKEAKAVYDTSSIVKNNCHQISHVIGRASALKYKTIVEAFNHGDNFCWSGYYHGVMEATAKRLGGAKVIATAPTICNESKGNKPYSFYHYNCVHGLGHGIMGIEDNELFDSLTVCDRFLDNWEQSSCYGGVFMENIMSASNPDHRTNYIKPDQPLYPCTAVDEKYKQQCYLMQTSQALVTENQDFDKVFALCDGVESPHNLTCYQSLGRDASGHTISSVEGTAALCNKGTSQVARSNCFVGAVKDFIGYFHKLDPGLQLCSAITEADTKNECITTANMYIQSF